MELGNVPDFALDQGINRLIDQIISGVTDLFSSLLSNTPPSILLQRVLGLTDGQTAALPKYLLGFAAFYLICGGITLLLHFKRGQKSLNSLAKQAVNVVLVIADFLLVPLLLVIWDMAKLVLGRVAPWNGELSDSWRFFTQAWSALFDPILLFAILLFTVLLPVQAAWRYWSVYHLAGVPHMVFDVGFGLYLSCAAMLSMLTSSRLWYLLLIPAIVMLCVGQTGGYIPDARNARSPDPAEAPAEKDSANPPNV